MWKQRQSPECKGIQVDFSTSRERLQDMRERAGKNQVFSASFTLERAALTEFAHS
jgi:hypothetical protein